MDSRWSWIGACSVGSSHIKAGNGCQDSAGCVEYVATDNGVLLAIVSDGAGTAEFGAVGSQLIVRSFSRNVMGFFRNGGVSNEVTEDLVRTWLDEVRDNLLAAANE